MGALPFCEVLVILVKGFRFMSSRGKKVVELKWGFGYGQGLGYRWQCRAKKSDRREGSDHGVELFFEDFHFCFFFANS